MPRKSRCRAQRHHREFRHLRRELEAKGAKFETLTNSEVVAHLVTDELKRGATPVEAVRAALPCLHGAFALAFLFAGEDNLFIGAAAARRWREKFGDGEMFVGSDAIALAPFTDTVSYLEDGDWASSPGAAPRSTTPMARPSIARSLSRKPRSC